MVRDPSIVSPAWVFCLSISSILPRILPQTSSQTQGNSRVSRMEHQNPLFPGNFRKRKVLGTHCFPFCLPENLRQPKTPTEGGVGRHISRRRESDRPEGGVRSTSGADHRPAGGSPRTEGGGYKMTLL